MVNPFTVRLRATYDVVTEESAKFGDFAESGYTDPANPWGGFDAPMPRELYGDAVPAWVAANVETVECATLWEAAEFVRDFPGAVWDYCEGEASQDYRTGAWRSVTLHVVDHAPAVFALADQLR